MRVRATLVALAALLILTGKADLALADGDPASDTLYSGMVFYPYAPAVSSTSAAQLNSLLRRVNKKGFPIRVALIARFTDLGTVTSLFNQPQNYAQFLSSELKGWYSGPVLVVMPNGFGLAEQGYALPTTNLQGITVPTDNGSDGLVAAAITAINALTHPSHASPNKSSGSSSLLIILGCAGVGLLGAGTALLLRRRQQRASSAR